jgi:hypothetical protein
VDLHPRCRFAGRCPHTAPACEHLDPPLTPRGSARSVACFLYERSSDVGVDAREMPTAEVRR